MEGSREELVRRGLALHDLGVDVVMPRGVRQEEDLAFFRQTVPEVPLMVIAGADDMSVQEYANLGYQIIIYATDSIIGSATPDKVAWARRPYDLNNNAFNKDMFNEEVFVIRVVGGSNISSIDIIVW